MTEYVNIIRTATGKLCAVCEFCGRKSRPATPFLGDRLSVFGLAQGWSEAPYSPDFVHSDGSTGSRWTCPACSRRMARGEALPDRGGQGTWHRLM